MRSTATRSKADRNDRKPGRARPAAKAKPRGQVVMRPVWKRFAEDEVEAAAKHVRGGGFSAIADRKGALKLLLPRTRAGDLTELALWVLLAVDLRNWGSARGGPAEGLAAAWVRSEDTDIAEGWCERDRAERRRTKRMELDCLTCGACCQMSRVVLSPADRAAWRRAGRPELEGRDYLRTSKGEVILRHAPSGACVHFGAGNRCAIYELRPSNCRVFPVGSEPCLTARSAMFG